MAGVQPATLRSSGDDNLQSSPSSSRSLVSDGISAMSKTSPSFTPTRRKQTQPVHRKTSPFLNNNIESYVISLYDDDPFPRDINSNVPLVSVNPGSDHSAGMKEPLITTAVKSLTMNNNNDCDSKNANPHIKTQENDESAGKSTTQEIHALSAKQHGSKPQKRRSSVKEKRSKKSTKTSVNEAAVTILDLTTNNRNNTSESMKKETNAKRLCSQPDKNKAVSKSALKHDGDKTKKTCLKERAPKPIKPTIIDQSVQTPNESTLTSGTCEPHREKTKSKKKPKQSANKTLTPKKNEQRRLTTEEIAILNMFDEVDISDRSSPYHSPQRTEVSNIISDTPISSKTPSKTQVNTKPSAPLSSKANAKPPKLSLPGSDVISAKSSTLSSGKEGKVANNKSTKEEKRKRNQKNLTRKSADKKNSKQLKLDQAENEKDDENKTAASDSPEKRNRPRRSIKSPRIFIDDDSDDQEISVNKKTKNGRKNKSPAKKSGKHSAEMDEDVKKYHCSHCKYSANSPSHIKVHIRTHTGERPYTCKVCQKGFIQASALKVHQRIHSDSRPCKCGICHRSFRTSGHLSDHLRVHTGERPYMCIQCRKTFRISSHLRTHLKIHSNERTHKCDHCERTFIQSSQLKMHLKTHNREAELKYACTTCGKKFLASWSLQLHTRTVHFHGHKPFVCDKCDKSFTIKAYLTRHKKCVHGRLKNLRIECPVCGKMLSKPSLRHHLLTHSSEKKHKCMVCQMSFNFSHSLLVHLRVHTKSMPFHCPICKVNFNSMSIMRRHIKKEHNLDPWEKKFKCDVCKKCFFSNGMLIRHQKEVHTKFRPYRCDKCESSFKNERNLKQHLRSHDETTFIKCDQCDKRFSQTGNLNIHMLTVHQKIKDFACDICPMRFATKRNLEQHVRTHTGEKPFKCSFCEKQFTQGGSLSRHQMTHTGKTPFTCDICSKGFTQKVHLLGHMKCHKKLSCPFCKNTYKTLIETRIHIKCHLDDSPYKCPQCAEAFNARNDFITHARSKCHLDGLTLSHIIECSPLNTTQAKDKKLGLAKGKKTTTRGSKRKAVDSDAEESKSLVTKLLRDEASHNDHKDEITVIVADLEEMHPPSKEDNIDSASSVEPLDLSMDLNSNVKTASDKNRKPLLRTHSITDVNKKKNVIVLQTL